MVSSVMFSEDWTPFFLAVAFMLMRILFVVAYCEAHIIFFMTAQSFDIFTLPSEKRTYFYTGFCFLKFCVHFGSSQNIDFSFNNIVAYWGIGVKGNKNIFEKFLEVFLPDVFGYLAGDVGVWATSDNVFWTA